MATQSIGKTFFSLLMHFKALKILKISHILIKKFKGLQQ